MLRRISADDPRFKSLSFRRGFNLIVADVTPESSQRDSRNSAGKSSLIELLHFLLGARADRNHVAMQKELRDISFELWLDWPNLPEGLTVRRSGSHADFVTLRPDVSQQDRGLFESVFETGSGRVAIKKWNELIETNLYSLPAEHHGLSGRTLLSYAMRRVSAHGFNEAIRSFSRQPEAEATTNLAYLLGLDWRLAGRYQDIRDRENTRNQLRKATADPIFGRIVGKTAELRGQITIVESRIRDLRRQTSDFRVVPQYEELKTRADELTRRIQQAGNEDAIDQRNIDQLERAIAETVDTDVEYLEPVYRELGIILGEQVRQRFDDVRNFHESVIRNRKSYLAQERDATRARLDARRAERSRLGDEQAAILQRLNEGGALESLTLLQQAVAQEEATLGALRHRLDAAEALEASARQIEASKLQLRQEIADDLSERREQTSEATVLFNEFAQRLYSEARGAYLAIDPGPSSLKIIPRIDSDNSRGIGNMAIFCFDLAFTVIAHREGRGPDFLVHDSHLFDGVDDRQLSAAFQLALEVASSENIQYIATINSDDLAKAERRGFAPGNWILEPRLTDAYDTGGLFGFRF